MENYLIPEKKQAFVQWFMENKGLWLMIWYVFSKCLIVCWGVSFCFQNCYGGVMLSYGVYIPAFSKDSQV